MMEMEIIRLYKLPSYVKGFTMLDDNGDYNIYINDALTHEARLEVLRHELDHIEDNDFYSGRNIEEAEGRSF